MSHRSILCPSVLLMAGLAFAGCSSDDTTELMIAAGASGPSGGSRALGTSGASGGSRVTSAAGTLGSFGTGGLGYATSGGSPSTSASLAHAGHAGVRIGAAGTAGVLGNVAGAYTGPYTVSILRSSSKLPANITLNFSVETSDGTGVAQLDADRFSLTEGGEIPSSTESNLTVFPQSMSYDLNTVLMLDLSGSVTSQWTSDLAQAARSFVDKILTKNGYRIAIYYIQTDIHPILDQFTDNRSDIYEALANLDEFVIAGASTNLYGAFTNGIRYLDSATVAKDRLRAGSLVVFTDGRDRAQRMEFSDAWEAVRATANSVFTVGLRTNDLDEARLRQLGKDGFEMAETLEELDPAFDRIVDRVWAEANKYYVVVYCSEKRLGAQQVVLSVRDADGNTRGSSSPFTYDTSSFQDGCFSTVEALKIQYYDADGDGYYSVKGAKHDCDDTDNVNWRSCYTFCKDSSVSLKSGYTCLAMTQSFEEARLPTGWFSDVAPRWRVDPGAASDLGQSVRAGAIQASGSSKLFLSAVTPSGDLCFDVKTSTEQCCDLLSFEIDGNLVSTFSGQTDWSKYCAPISDGIHEFSWTYSKNASVDEGQDTAWVDRVTFAALGSAGAAGAPQVP